MRRLSLIALALVLAPACVNAIDTRDPLDPAASGDAASPADVEPEAGDAAPADAAPDDQAAIADEGQLEQALTSATCGSTAHTGDYCGTDKVNGDRNTLYRCNGPGPATVVRTCSAGCVIAPAGQDDSCRAAPPTCDANAFTGEYCGSDKVTNAARNTLYHCNGPGPATVVQACAAGCTIAPPGQDDFCAASAPGGNASAADTCPHQALLRWGMAPDASDGARCAGVTAGRISQTIGNAPASAGYHARDGVIHGAPYCAATDISVRGMSHAEIRALLSRMADDGFAAFFRNPGQDGWPSSQSPHIHAVYAGVAMKSQLRGQVTDWLDGRNGLASHGRYTFWQPSSSQKARVRQLFHDAN